MAADVQKKSITVLGPGAIGGFLASMFWKQGHRVNCIATPAGAEHITQHGLRFKSDVFGEFTAYPHAETFATSKPDILFVSVKAPMLADALAKVPPECIEQSIIIPFLNGFEHVDILRHRYGNRVVPGSISIEVVRSELGIIHHMSPHAAVRMASHDIDRKKLERIKQIFTGAGISCKIYKKEADVIWEKLVRLNAITCAIAASNKPLGFVRSNSKWRKILEACVKEAVHVARKVGADSDPKIVMAHIDALPASLRTSLSRDINAGNIGELDAIAGAIVRQAAHYGIATPTIELMIQKISSRRAKINK